LSTRLFVAAIGLASGCLLYAADASKQDEPKQKVEISKTERFDFPSGGTLRFSNSVGTLTVEAWDRPDVEMTTIKSSKIDLNAHGREKATHSLEGVKVAAERHGDELVITTKFPPHRPFRVPYPFSGETGFDLEYRIKAPANARIIVAHTLGEVNIDGLAGDIQVTVAQGQILLHLPGDGKYDIHAHSDFGSVNSDFSEEEKRDWWMLGHRSVDNNAAAPHKLNLKVGFGDIVILKTRIPKSPEPAPSAQKTEGL
jgi:hypothetical protein